MTKIDPKAKTIQFMYPSFIVGEKVKLNSAIAALYKLELDKATDISKKYVINTGANAPLVALFPEDLSVEIVEVSASREIKEDNIIFDFLDETVIYSEYLLIYDYYVKTPEGISFHVTEDCLKKNTLPKKEKKSKTSKVEKETKLKTDKKLLEFYINYKNDLPLLSYTKKVKKTIKNILDLEGFDEITAKQILLYNDWLREQNISSLKIGFLEGIVKDAIAENLSAKVFIQDIQESYDI